MHIQLCFNIHNFIDDKCWKYLYKKKYFGRKKTLNKEVSQSKKTISHCMLSTTSFSQSSCILLRLPCDSHFCRSFSLMTAVALKRNEMIFTDCGLPLWHSLSSSLISVGRGNMVKRQMLIASEHISWNHGATSRVRKNLCEYHQATVMSGRVKKWKTPSRLSPLSTCWREVEMSQMERYFQATLPLYESHQ